MYQLAHAVLPRRFPLLHAGNAVPTNLPVRLTSFVRRTDELGDVQRLIASERLVASTGAGGCGKTRLAIEALSRASEMFDGGVWFCDLAPVADPAAVAQTLCAAVGARVETFPSDSAH